MLLAGGASHADSDAPPAVVQPPPSAPTVPQPSLDKLSKETRSHIAPESQRVDLVMPTFTKSTDVSNPLFPIRDLHSVVLVGKFEGKPWRAETTLLSETRTVEWNGTKIKTLQSQFIAYLSGRIYEVAVDKYAQADDGAVWYFGEDAFSYEKGRISAVNETWHAGVEGPATMIMPGHPRVGDVYRPENIPGLIFEQVTVKQLSQTRDGPTGPVTGVMVGEELHMEGDLEDKTFAPGYGELRSGLGNDYEATALAIPADALSETLPSELSGLLSATLAIVDAARATNWTAAAAGIDTAQASYAEYRKRRLPGRLDMQMADALDVLAKAAKARNARTAALDALDVGRVAADLMLRYQPAAKVDRIRFDLWARELIIDADAKDTANVSGDAATLGWLRDRMAFDVDDAGRVDDQLHFLIAASDAKDVASAAIAAERLRKTVANLPQT
jgi:hypothetical protein